LLGHEDDTSMSPSVCEIRTVQRPEIADVESAEHTPGMGCPFKVLSIIPLNHPSVERSQHVCPACP
jgi:hypothetical protein